MNQSASQDLSKRDYLKQQQQLRTMARATTTRSADDMIEDLLSKKEIFKKKESGSNSNQGSPYPKWLTPGSEEPYYLKVWGLVHGGGGFADTTKLTNLLLSSHLTTDGLGFIWSLTNKTVAGVLTQQETYLTLGLVALAQAGYRFNSVLVLNDLNQSVIPSLDLSTVPLSCPINTLHQSSFLPLEPLLPPTTLPVAEPKINPQKTSVDPLSQTLPLSVDTLSSSIDSILFLSPTETPSFELPTLSTLQPNTNPLPPQSLHNVSDSVQSELSQGINLLDIAASNPAVPITKPLFPLDPQPVSIPSLPNPLPKNSLSDFDVFGDFQSPPVSLPPPKSLLEDDDDEFDDFKSADFSGITPSSLTVIEVAPHVDAPPHDDLFPKCVVNKKCEDPVVESFPPPSSAPLPVIPPPVSSTSESNDKYSALRILQSDSPPPAQDDFGDFLTAQPPPPADIASLGQSENIQIRCLEACIKVLEEGVRIFEAITDRSILTEVTSDPRGVKYLEELVEVKKVGERILSKLNDPVGLDHKWNIICVRLEPFTSKHSKSCMEYSRGPKCGVCLSEEGPHQVRYGINSFHAPCANLLLHFVQSSLPIAPLL